MSADAMEVRDDTPPCPGQADAQDVPPGYKRTDVGVIPADWELSACGELCVKIQDGTHFSPSSSGGDFLYVTSRNIGRGRLDVSDADRIGEVEHRKIFARCDTRRGDLLLTKDGANTGNAAINNLDEECSLLSSVAFLRFDARFHDTRFYLQFVLSHEGQQQIKDAMSGNAITRLTLSKICQLVFPSPQLCEQRAIANALSDVDVLLGTLDALIAKKRAIKQAAMQQLLTGKTRLPGLSGEWETKPLGQIAEIEMGQSPSSEFYNTKGSGLPLIQGNADVANRRTIRRIFTTQITKRGRCGDILLSVRAPVGEVARATFDVCLGRGVCAIRVPNDFLFHYLVYLERSWAKHSKGSTFDSVNSADVRAVEIALPDPNEQRAIATVLSDMDAEIAALEARRHKTHAIKQGMMQQLLTGRVRLVESEAAA